MNFKELTNKMKKGEAPSFIGYKGIVYKYDGINATKEERLEDIKKNGLWNNGGYYSENNDFLLDNLVENDFRCADIVDLSSLQENNKETIVSIPDDELYELQEENIMLTDEYRIDYNFKVLKEKINQVVEELNRRNNE